MDQPFRPTVGFTGWWYLRLSSSPVYTRFRDQACIVVCPYPVEFTGGFGLTRNSMVIADDYQRGGTRGKIHKGEDES